MQENGSICAPWSDASWQIGMPTTKFRLPSDSENFRSTSKSIVAEISKDAPFSLPLPDTFSVPALMAFPNQASLLIHSERAGRTRPSRPCRW